MADHVLNREAVIISSLKEELVGPRPAGRPKSFRDKLVFAVKSESYGPWYDEDTGEEVLDRSRPMQRYGVGVLYPRGLRATEDVSNANGLSNLPSADSVGDSDRADNVDELLSEKALSGLSKIEQDVAINSSADSDADDFELSTANSYRPSSMGISFFVKAPPKTKIKVTLSGGRYLPVEVLVEGKRRYWWRRIPVHGEFIFESSNFSRSKKRKKLSASNNSVVGCENINIESELHYRWAPQHSDDHYLVTAVVLNRTDVIDGHDQFCIFQTSFEVALLNEENDELPFEPYPSLESDQLNEEEMSLQLLYRNVKTYAIGHGCAAGWKGNSKGNIIGLSADVFPVVEVPSITADIVKKDKKTPIEVELAPLAGLRENDGMTAIDDLITHYENWIGEQSAQVVNLPSHTLEVGRKHIERCRNVLARIADGRRFLQTDKIAAMAFRLANHAVLLQQINSDRVNRSVEYDENLERLFFKETPLAIDPSDYKGRRGKWRAFQISFLLMSLRSAVVGDDSNRETVELIWFPTGGGKTEAYLGLSAFGMFYRRLSDPSDVGVHVLMRYTLRLLTAQQFQRAAGLICAMEFLRKKDSESLGKDSFSIGLWLGGDVTPNKRTDAITKFKEMQTKNSTKNPFILDRCPWCRAQMGSVDIKGLPRKVPRVIGYDRGGGSVIFRCFDSNCEFKGQLPIYVVDEDLYEFRPTLIIATVDKLANLAWRPEARRIFGLNYEGSRVASPPGLIIQDELHLISGPLGSMVGLYESVIEELCTDRRGDRIIPPKIVSSTATIRRYEEQIKSLYARDKVCLFPSPGLDAGDSFFARYAEDENGNKLPGKIFVGVFAPGLGSMQTVQVRTFSALLQAPMRLATEKEKDPWWTLLLFFNSLRELGTTLSLYQSDIPDYLKTMFYRYNIPNEQRRKLYKFMELTGRLRSDEIPKIISDLESRVGGKFPVDTCLASNIIEVGIDIDRLSLLSIVGQPKTTSQYIQVSGRVGRNKDKPGLVVTLYGVSKPRDRSHFEKFRSYHEKLYAQVEPTSATPFAPPVLDRALHGVIASFVRQLGDVGMARSPHPIPENFLEGLKKQIGLRVKKIDPAEEKNFLKIFDRRISEWKRWGRVEWNSTQSNERALMRVAGSYISPDLKNRSWATPSSLRNVDAQCEAHVTDLYSDTDQGDNSDI